MKYLAYCDRPTAYLCILIHVWNLNMHLLRNMNCSIKLIDPTDPTHRIFRPNTQSTGKTIITFYSFNAEPPCFLLKAFFTENVAEKSKRKLGDARKD